VIARVWVWVQRLRNVVASVLLPSVLSKLAAPFKEFADLIAPKRGTDNKEASTAKGPLVIANVASSPPAQSQSAKGQHPHAPWWRTTAEIIGIAAVVWYAFLTNHMWKEMREQTRIQTAAQRPWLGMFGQVSLTAPPIYRVGAPGQVELGLEGAYVVRNFGASPAFYANNWVSIELLMSDSTITRPPVSRVFCVDGPTKLHEGEVIFPDSGVNFGFNQQIARLIPGKNITEVNRVWLTGCISYVDGAQQLHHTRFWLRSAHPDNAQWIVLTNGFRYMPINGFESWGEESD
jgi:hypothetical protein